jgi:hypothetical protein
MSAKCEYCGVDTEHSGKCTGCGAPVAARIMDFRLCPFCRRKLLSLASAHCNHCGRQLPADYIEARAAQLHRIQEINPPPKRVENDEDDDLGIPFSF